MVLSVALLKCCTAAGRGCDVNITTESSNKWIRFQVRSTTIVDVVICVMFEHHVFLILDYLLKILSSAVVELVDFEILPLKDLTAKASPKMLMLLPASSLPVRQATGAEEVDW